MRKIILASSSPFRKSLLARLQLTFECTSPNIDESSQPNESPKQLVARLAKSKALAIASTESNAIIIGSDQVATCEDRILGKPGTIEKATEQLKYVSGKTVTYQTGLCVLNSKTQTSQVEVISFHVDFRCLTDKMIASYLSKEPAIGCAGSFKSEALGVALTNRMHGDDATALVGLPLISLVKMLETEGVDII